MHLEEPWFNLSLSSYENSSASNAWRNQDEIIWNQNQRQQNKHIFYQLAYDFISSNRVSGDYFEFGCHRCRTFRMAMLEAKRHFLDEMRFYAFDSFEGLPEGYTDHEVKEWIPGALKTDDEIFKRLILQSGFCLDKVTLCKGYYENSLSDKKVIEIFDNTKASMINIDCDYYESAVPIFSIIDKILQEGTILYIDDYFAGYKGNPTKGVSRAMIDWLDTTVWKLESYLNVGWSGKSFIAYQ